MSETAVVNALNILAEGLPVYRVKRSKLVTPLALFLDQNKNLVYEEKNKSSNVFKCLFNKNKKVNVTDLIEIRQGYNSDGLHKASKHFKFQEAAPESNCFSIIFKHPRFVCKSIDFVSKDERKSRLWLEALSHVMNQSTKNSKIFNEKIWIINNFRKADLNNNGEIAFNELWKLLKKLNLQLSEDYVRAIFEEITLKKQRIALNENEFFELFQMLSDLPEYRNALRLANVNGEEYLDQEGVLKFLTEEQGFTSVSAKKAEAVIKFCETNVDEKNKLLSINGFRRLLQSRWGHILKENHESIFQDMNQPLSHYFINSSHNTYLIGLQVYGNATVEGYISALRKGARLLELDVFDGDNGEPSITHKRTFISAISLRNALKCIVQYAFQTNPYPVILTIENHVGLIQQRVMVEIFEQILGDKLYIISPNETSKPLPSPNFLKNKILLRGKTSGYQCIADENENADDPNKSPQMLKMSVDPAFGRLISLPSVKLSVNMYSDIEKHSLNGSPSLSEGKVLTYLESEAPIFAYTANRIIKSYPKAIRQDSSNMNPIPSWLCGIQAVAMNMQTASEEMDIVNGFFNINGNIGYVLKPKILLDGLDPRRESSNFTTKLRIALICGQYFPKPKPGHDIIDPFVCIQIFGTAQDECNVRTRAVRNNGFNPVWNENFVFMLSFPDLAILRFSVKDFDSTSANDFIGEFTVPVNCIRKGYSHIRLNTGLEHSADDAASILVRIEFENV